MKLFIRKPTTIFTVSLCVGLVILSAILFALLLRPVSANSDISRESGRLMTIHDRGQEVVILTDATTVAGAVEEAGIEVDRHDRVEPSLDEKLVASEYSVNIYRARPVTVIDGVQRTKIITAYQTPQQIAVAADVTLYEEDLALMQRSYNFTTDGAGTAVVIDRAVAFSFDMYGAMNTVRTQAQTVGEMLNEKGIELGDSGRVSPSQSTAVTEGMSVRVWREGKQTMTVTEPVAFPVEQIQDADRLVGYKEIRTPGQNGERSVTYEVEIVNGVEVSRAEIASLVVTPAVTQVEVVGTKQPFLPYTGGGTKTQWLAASQIPEESWGYADFMVQKESSWNPNAINRSSGACGLAQALPCSKIPGQWNDPVNALNWMNNYVNGRYKSWENAYNFWQANRWY